MPKEVLINCTRLSDTGPEKAVCLVQQEFDPEEEARKEAAKQAAIKAAQEKAAAAKAAKEAE